MPLGDAGRVLKTEQLFPLSRGADSKLVARLGGVHAGLAAIEHIEHRDKFVAVLIQRAHGEHVVAKLVAADLNLQAGQGLRCVGVSLLGPLQKKRDLLILSGGIQE